MLTVDVEAQPGRAAENHVERLIWGKFPEGRAGIAEMMDVCDQYEAKLTMFLDWAETDIYGDAICEVGRGIARRGHDLQLHVHSNFFSPEFYTRNQIKPQSNLNRLDERQSECIVAELVARQMSETGVRPVAFRGGGYRYSANLLNALANHQIVLDSTTNISRSTQPIKPRPSKQFLWSNGVLEIPVSCVRSYRNLRRDFDFNFNASSLPDVQSMHEYLDIFWKERGSDAIAVLVMHSWSFLQKGQDGHYEYSGAAKIERLDGFLAGLPNDVEIVTAQEVCELFRRGDLAVDPVLPFEDIGATVPDTKLSLTASDQVTATTKQIAPIWPDKAENRADRSYCTICKWPMEANRDGTCPNCRSRPQTRTLSEVISGLIKYVRPDIPNSDKIVAVNASKSELRVLGSFFGDVESVTLGREQSIDRSISSCADGAVRAVFMSGVLEFAETMEAGLRQCSRILCPSGIMLSSIHPHRLVKGLSGPVLKGPPISIEGNRQSRFQPHVLGKDWLLERMRTFGLEPRHKALMDPVTGTWFDWFICVRSSDQATSIATAARTRSLIPVDPLIPVGSGRCSCLICGADLSNVPSSNINCPECGAAPRTRSLVSLVRNDIAPLWKGLCTSDKPLLSFAMTTQEQAVLSPKFGSFKSVSLYGSYGNAHESGVDARDLSRYSEGAFSGHYGILLFDYFEEHDCALAEAARVLIDGGIFFHHISTARLVEGNSPPVVTSIIRKRPGYFDYTPDDASMVSVKVGIEWFVLAMERAGFDARHVAIKDEHSDEISHWFMGIKRPRPETKQRTSDTTSVVNREKSFPVPEWNSIKGGETIVWDCAEEARSKEWVVVNSIPVSGLEGVDRILLSSSVPALPLSLKSCDFAEHVFDRQKRTSTDEIVIVGRGRIGFSADLGDTWCRVDVGGFEEIRFHRCFTTQSGRKIVQAIGWLGRSDSLAPQLKHGLLFVFSQDWELISVVKAGHAHWHGSASIDEKNGVIMYAEYHDNGTKYAPKFSSSPDLQSLVQSNKIWRSTDDGEQWEVVFEQSASDIRHFHTLIADPFDANVWWASSGDLAAECKVWRSPDNGDTWVDCSDADPTVHVPKSYRTFRRAALRYTDALIAENYLLWGADDLMGVEAELDPSLAQRERAGARLYRSAKSIPLKVEEIAYVGQPVRSIVDVGKGCIVTTEGKAASSGFRPSIYFMTHFGNGLVKLIDVDNYRNLGSGFTYSLSSRKAKEGIFFTYKRAYDLFDESPRIAKFTVTYAKD